MTSSYDMSLLNRFGLNGARYQVPVQQDHDLLADLIARLESGLIYVDHKHCMFTMLVTARLGIYGHTWASIPDVPMCVGHKSGQYGHFLISFFQAPVKS